MRNARPRPEYRPLKVYAFDPTRGKTLGNIMTVRILNEALNPGPASWRVAVVDYDPANRRYYEPVDLNDPDILLRGGLDPSESNPQFHQQMVYAVATKTLRHFDLALGRWIRWGGFNRPPLRIFPQALQEANAYYNPDLHALLFGYFRAAGASVGSNLPGQTVFTCLSHDIVAHETSHAAVNAVRKHFTELTGPDSLAFHEAFADIAALFQHFTMPDALLETIRRTGGRLYQAQLQAEVAPEGGTPLAQVELRQDNPLVGLAQQFGEAMGRRSALRSAISAPPNSELLPRVFEPHARGSILVAAVFDAFFTINMRRALEYFRIAEHPSGPNGRELSLEMATALAKVASRTAEHFMNICIRALDYCPPVDMTFGEFLRALITADAELVPVDERGYRDALIQAFRLRGIRPEGAVSYSEDALLWQPPEEDLPPCDGLFFDVFRGFTTVDQMKKNAARIVEYAESNRAALHLDAKAKITPYGLRAVHRVRPSGAPSFEVFVQLLQERQVPLEENSKSSATFTYRGGATLILDARHRPKYVIYKNLEDQERLARQRQYLREGRTSLAEAPYEKESALRREAGGKIETRANFAAVHRGY